jgi:hypothetical protein
MPYGSVLSGLGWISLGVVLLLSWKVVFNAIMTTHLRTWGRIGAPVGSERVNRFLVRTIVTVIAAVCMIAGFGDLYEAATGHEFPLRTAQWSDLWPF